MEEGLTGGCACGSVRYRLTSEPFDCGWCHCRICQLSSGAPAMAFASVPSADFLVSQGEAVIRRFDSSSFGHRLFCGTCGTALAMKVDHQPETVDFGVATLDNPDIVPPELHIFYASKAAWFEAADDLPRHEKFRPDTRGLNGNGPPA